MIQPAKALQRNRGLHPNRCQGFRACVSCPDPQSLAQVWISSEPRYGSSNWLAPIRARHRQIARWFFPILGWILGLTMSPSCVALTLEWSIKHLSKPIEAHVKPLLKLIEAYRCLSKPNEAHNFQAYQA